jgi:hypothetical protein
MISTLIMTAHTEAAAKPGPIERVWLDSLGRVLAESEGFEPPSPCGLTVFKTAAFDRSANSPIIDILGFSLFAAPGNGICNLTCNRGQNRAIEQCLQDSI